MKVTMLLADAAQAIDNKLYILGGGWSIIGPDPAPSAIALKIEVPWTDTNRKHRLELKLLDADGQPVRVPTQAGEHPVEFRGEFEVGRPPGLPEGSPLDMALAINMGPLPLQPGRRYEWKCFINENTKEDWRVGFYTRSANK
ncbi:MAG: hypothetical protein KGL31_06080 [candidate division NC10 bacterium]|nr:hypothetical protein [candidate division NC10 bacterium]MDE2321472.1 hypothetical protein [candidate division NC10 bacterium]